MFRHTQKCKNYREQNLQLPWIVNLHIYRYNFHILKEGVLLFVCMASATFKNKVAFAFLQELKKKFKEIYSN